VVTPTLQELAVLSRPGVPAAWSISKMLWS